MKFLKKIVGIHLERKRKTKYLNIERMSDVPYIRIPLNGDLEKVVNIGDYVEKWQLVAEGEITPSLHSPVSGRVEEIVKGNMSRDGYEKMLVIKNDFEENQCEISSVKDYAELDSADFIEILKDKGILGMGGRGYPTYLKIKRAFENGVKILIVNGCECEPYLNCDNRLMQEKAKEIIDGIEILVKVLKLELVIIAVEENKTEAAVELKKALKTRENIQLKVLKKIYPLGEERILIREIFGEEISKDIHPVDNGYLVQNVATIFAVYEAIVLGKPLIDRVITVAGESISESKNLKIKIGTPLGNIADYLGMKNDVEKIIFGGPMTGKALYSLEKEVIQKKYGGVLFLSKEEAKPKKTQACIYCGSCVDKCPMGLMPLKFEEFLRQNDLKQLMEINLNDCVECGICSYICPSNRPLLESVVIGKKIIEEV